MKSYRFPPKKFRVKYENTRTILLSVFTDLLSHGSTTFVGINVFQRCPVLNTIGDKISDVVSGVMPVYLR